MNNKKVIIIIACDVDPDRNPNGKSLEGNEEIWKGVLKGIPELKDILNSFTHAGEDPYPNITWLLRSDKQMDMLYGDYAYPVNYFWDMWNAFRQEGDEIGWHPHLWDWCELNGGYWYPHIEGDKWINNCLTNGYNAIAKYLKPTSVRTGWDFQSNLIMKKLDNQNFIVDLSALPNQKVIEYKDKHILYKYDWKITSEEFYFPSKKDYRMGVEIAEDSLDILEMPVSLTPISLYRAITKFLYHNTRHLFNKSLSNPIISYPFHTKEPLRITKNPKLFEPGVKTKFKESKIKNCTEYIITYFHPNELLRNDLFSLSNFEKNLDIISGISKKYDVPFKFLTATIAAEYYTKRQVKL